MQKRRTRGSTSPDGLRWLSGGPTRLAGVQVGHATHLEGATGVTVVIFDAPVPGGVDIRGGAAGTRQFGALDPMHVAGRLDAVCFAGGSAHGLEAGTGVARWLERRGRGLAVLPGQTVPIVPTAILFDLGLGRPGVRPDAAMAEAACEAAGPGPVAEGSVGAGTGASVGKCDGQERATKGGLGTAVARLPSGHHVAALVVVNAFGDVVDPATGAVLAGVRAGRRSARFVSSRRRLLARGHLARYGAPPENTTLALVVTDAPVDRTGLTLVARLGGQGMVRTLDPCHTPVDGDLTLAVSTAGEPGSRAAGADPSILGLAAAEAVQRAILTAIHRSVGISGLPAASELA